jgi:molecular chaperone GrpE
MTQKKTAESVSANENIPSDQVQADAAGEPAGDQFQDIPSLLTELERVRAEATENLDKFLRSRAETENVRRRAETDVANAHKYAIERFALEMLTVKDSLERARGVEVQDSSGVVNKMFEGLDLTIKLMESIFLKFNLVPVEPGKGDKFDPEKHQAMSVLESAEMPANHVVVAVQKGYILNDRLLRPAMVIVSRAVTQPGSA